MSTPEANNTPRYGRGLVTSRSSEIGVWIEIEGNTGWVSSHLVFRRREALGYLHLTLHLAVVACAATDGAIINDPASNIAMQIDRGLGGLALDACVLDLPTLPAVKQRHASGPQGLRDGGLIEIRVSARQTGALR